MLKHALTTSAFAALMLSSAFAQSPPATAPDASKPMTAPSTSAAPAPSPSAMPAPSTSAPSAGDTFVLHQNGTDWRASKLIGSNVIGPDNAKIGDINDLLIENNGTVRAVVIGVGGFLGMGEKSVAIPLKSLVVTPSANGDKIEKLTVSFTKDQLKNAPEFAWNEAPARIAPEKRTENMPRR